MNVGITAEIVLRANTALPTSALSPAKRTARIRSVAATGAVDNAVCAEQEKSVTTRENVCLHASRFATVRSVARTDAAVNAVLVLRVRHAADRNALGTASQTATERCAAAMDAVVPAVHVIQTKPAPTVSALAVANPTVSARHAAVTAAQETAAHVAKERVVLGDNARHASPIA